MKSLVWYKILVLLSSFQFFWFQWDQNDACSSCIDCGVNLIVIYTPPPPRRVGTEVCWCWVLWQPWLCWECCRFSCWPRLRFLCAGGTARTGDVLGVLFPPCAAAFPRDSDPERDGFQEAPPGHRGLRPGLHGRGAEPHIQHLHPGTTHCTPCSQKPSPSLGWWINVGGICLWAAFGRVWRSLDAQCRNNVVLARVLQVVSHHVQVCACVLLLRSESKITFI